MQGEPRKTFYLQTFGCQMNVHDSEKVIGTLMSEGYRAGPDSRRRRPDSLQHLLDPRQGRAESIPPPERLQKTSKAGKEVRRAGMRGAAGRRKDFRARAACIDGVRFSVVPEPARDARANRSREARDRVSTTARPKNVLRPSSLPAQIPIAGTSPSSKAATSFAPIA